MIDHLRQAFLLSFVIICSFGYSQMVVFETYEDFLSNKGVKYEGYTGQVVSSTNVKYIFKKDGVKTKIDCKKIWGFSYNEGLFRVDHESGLPVRVLSIGKVIYYENGQAHFNMLDNDTDLGSIGYGSYCYFSNSLNSQIFEMPMGEYKSDDKKVESYLESHPEYQVLFQCFEGKYDYKKIRVCVETFNANE